MVELDAKSFSMKTVPESWRAAAAEAGEEDTTPLPSKRSVGTLPIRTEADVLTGSIAGLAMSVVFGSAWYAFESRDLIQSPWMAVLAGVLIAISVRLGMGPDHSDIRATISLIFYIATVFIVAYAIESYDFAVLRGGQRPSFAETQTELVRDRLTEPMMVLAWGVGVFAALQTGYLLRRRR